ncbi:MAG: SH3 domain-containing protein [Anaerolineales bacterium]|nr:SH3 domain-containing protein [Anaerolineales bacterium]MCW5856372.1 SH3 domain-containing protein [Anaerolineales bacterium]
MRNKTALLVFAVVAVLLLAACGGNTDAAIATGIAQTQQISSLETAAAGAQATPEPTQAPTEAEATPVPITTSRDVNLRTGDSTAYPVITVVSGGETLQLTGVNQAGTWYQVSFRNTSGWISADFIEGEIPSDLPVVAPAAPPPQATATSSSSGGGGGGSGGPVSNYVLILDANDTDNKSISDTVSGNNVHRITIQVQGLSGSNSVEVDIAFQCDTSQPEKVKLTAPGATDNVICNNNWSHQVSSSNPAVITVQLDGINSAKWTVIANVSP